MTSASAPQPASAPAARAAQKAQTGQDKRAGTRPQKDSGPKPRGGLHQYQQICVLTITQHLLEVLAEKGRVQYQLYHGHLKS